MGKAKVTNIKRLIVSAVLCASSLLLSCSRSWTELEPPGIPEYRVWIYVYLPYVESVELPETIRANEPFNITVKLSAVLKPEILKAYGVKKPEIRVFNQPTETQGLSVSFLVHLSDIPITGYQVAELALEAPPLEEGDYSLKMSSADSREWGGLDLTFNEGSLRLLHPENDAHRKRIEIPFTVLPADDGGGE